MRTTGREWNRNGSELNHSVSNSEMVSYLYTHSAYTHLINISLLLWGVICDAGQVHILKSALLSVISRTCDIFNKTFSLFEFREVFVLMCNFTGIFPAWQFNIFQYFLCKLSRFCEIALMRIKFKDNPSQCLQWTNGSILSIKTSCSNLTKHMALKVLCNNSVVLSTQSLWIIDCKLLIFSLDNNASSSSK